MTLEEALSLARELAQAGRFEDACTVCSKILAADPDHAATLHLLGVVWFRLGDAGAAVRYLEQSAAAAPSFAVAFNDLGNILMHQGKSSEAIERYRQAIAIRPDYPEAHNNLGNALQMAGSPQDAVASYQQALRFRPDYAEAYRNLGSALRSVGRNSEAIEAFRSAVRLNPRYGDALAQLLNDLRSQCDWTHLEPLTRQLIELVDAGTAAVDPFVFLSLDTTARQQYHCALRWAAEHVAVAPSAKLPPPGERSRRDGRITLGYLSADFQEHATAQLTARMFALHDRRRFRVIAYSYGADDGGPMRRRLVESFDEFVDLRAVPHAEAAARIRADGVQILVDLKGYTRDARPQITAMRPAPVQVSYLGYPGTMGTSAIDYILADSIVLPFDQQSDYAESIVHLPGCYQVNDSTRPISPRAPTRAECGLPERALVLCCFSGSEKITPKMFDIWVRLLGAVPDAVLWLLASNPQAVENLRREAEARLAGAAGKLIFAPALPNPDHLARFALADLFLDTLPYNAHTLAADSLWGGCPVLTCSAATFPSRVAASLLHAAQLPELVTTTPDDYEAVALRLAHNREGLTNLRERLKANRLSAPLFDTARFTRNVETAYEMMWQRYLSGEAPQPFAVPETRPLTA